MVSIENNGIDVLTIALRVFVGGIVGGEKQLPIFFAKIEREDGCFDYGGKNEARRFQL